MAVWALTAQLTTGTLAVTDPAWRIWWNSGVAITDNVVVGAYQDNTHISNASDVHQCTPHVNNTKWRADSGATSLSLNGAADSNISALTNAQAGLKFNFSDAASVLTSNGKFYAYDGTTEATAMAGVTFKAAEAVISTAWVTANGSAAALTLQDDTTATSHDFFIATSISPTSTGAKSGKVKISLTYV